ncbi:MAG: AAA family ATPase [Verrucomicrobia bacterium]|nr:AAA family ATPase [Verrucomicrobiota bacterium]
MAKNVFSEILSWSKELSPWQNEVIRRLFAKGVLTPADKDEIFEEAKVEHGLAPAPPKQVDLMLKATDLPTPPTPGQRIQLNGVRELLNVNALRGDRLVIGKQLTIIYGENASGKSGYARVMKKAFRARAVDPILQNVYIASSTIRPASALFEIEEAGKVRDEKWTDGVQSPECLGRFAVFDSKCARAYVSESNELAFVPYGFDILNGLGAITNEVKRRFQELARSSAPKPDALQPLIDDTTIGKQLSALTTTSNEAAITANAKWVAADDSLLSDKEAELANLRANSPQKTREALVAQKRRLETIRTELNTVAGAISDEKVTTIKNKVGELVKYQEAVAASAKLAFGDLDLSGIGGDVWRELLIAAEAYSTQEAYPGQSYPAPVKGVKCVLCLQPLEPAAQDRLARFWNFIQDDTSKKRDTARVAVAQEQEVLARVPKTLPKHIEILEDPLKAAGSTVYEAVKTYFAAVPGRVQAMESAIRSGAWNSIAPAPAFDSTTCNTEIAAIERRLKEITDDGQATAAIQALSKEVAELKARKRVTENINIVTGHLKSLKLSAAADRAASKITTNAISFKAGDLQNTYVTEDFKKTVQDELKPLGLVRVRAGVDRRSEKGKVLHKVTIDGVQHATPESVFSEGERTAISLACFLAELLASDDNCGIVFDDPVTSLDHRIRDGIVKRLVIESSKRQVIIFTHDLVFYRELVAAAERQKVDLTFQNVEALGTNVGILTDIPPWDAMKVNQRAGRLDQIVSAAKKAEAAGDTRVYRQIFGEFYSLLRSTWERSVEEVLFNQVVQRLEKEVKTMRLDGVQVDDEAVEAVFQGMSRSSDMIKAHDHAAANNSSLPSTDELAHDLEALKQFVSGQKTKCKDAEKRLAHLKK